MFKNIVVPLKEGLPSTPMTDLAQRIAAPNAKVHLVTFLTSESREIGLERLKGAEGWLRDIAGRLRADIDVTAEAGVVLVSPAQSILSIAQRRDADLLVIGMGKRSRVGKALMGSDAQSMLIGSQCPVIVAPLRT